MAVHFWVVISCQSQKLLIKILHFPQVKENRLLFLLKIVDGVLGHQAFRSVYPQKPVVLLSKVASAMLCFTE